MVAQVEKKLSTKERRVLVGPLVQSKTPKGEIAIMMDVTPKTISSDVKYLKSLWLKDMLGDAPEQIALELATIAKLEQIAWGRYYATSSYIWWDRIMKCQERRAKLLGLDRAPQGSPGASPERPLWVAPAQVAPGQIDWENVPDDIAEELVLLHSRLLALQPGVEGLIVDGDAEALPL